MKNQDDRVTLDLHNRVTGEELEKLLMMQLNALAANSEMASALPPLMVWGAPGLGKSSILRDVARDLGLDSSTCASRNASLLTFVDFPCRDRTA